MPEITNNPIRTIASQPVIFLNIIGGHKLAIIQMTEFPDPLFRIISWISSTRDTRTDKLSPPRPGKIRTKWTQPKAGLRWVQITQIVLFLGPLIDSDWLITPTPTQSSYFILRLRQFREQQKNDIPEYKMASRMPYGVVLHCGTFRSGRVFSIQRSLIDWSLNDLWLADKNALIWKPKWAWDLIIFICTIYVAALVPYQAVFKRDGYDLAASNL